MLFLRWEDYRNSTFGKVNRKNQELGLGHVIPKYIMFKIGFTVLLLDISEKVCDTIWPHLYIHAYLYINMCIYMYTCANYGK